MRYYNNPEGYLQQSMGSIGVYTSPRTHAAAAVVRLSNGNDGTPAELAASRE